MNILHDTAFLLLEVFDDSFSDECKNFKNTHPVDGSEASMNACDYAIFRAKSMRNYD
ncbi:MAG: hypothetical protein WA323_21780 [Candidatus Nitrosopolaris sp.]|jgi:hypothetical protein